MRRPAYLSFIASLATLAWANTEKTIFIAPAAVPIPNASPSLDALGIDRLTPQLPVLRTAVSVSFPNETHVRGLESWYLLQNLHPGQRHEVRVCWPAVQPTEFWLDVHNLTHVFDTPELIQSLAAFAESRQTLPREIESSSPGATVDSVLFLHVSAAADYYSSNKSLMQSPPAVDVDIILDPFLANVLPVSLIPTVGYILLLGLGAWFLSGSILAFLQRTTSFRQKVE